MNKTKILVMAAAALMFASCADDNYQDFRTAAPERGAQYAYLNEYGDLKTYVDRAKYPMFKLGGATDAATFNKQGLVYALDVANFDELVTGNSFKYSSVVGDDGSMDFTVVKEFVDKATEAGLSVYGHTLAWHAQQNIKYLGKLIADRIPEGDGGKSYVFQHDFEDGQPIGGWGKNQSREVIDNGYDGKSMKATNPSVANPWESQMAVDLAQPLTEGTTYTLHFWAKGSQEGSITAGYQNPDGYKGCGDFPVINLTTDWKEYTIEATVTGPGATRFLFSIGSYAGDIYMDNIELYTGATPTVDIPKTVVKYDFEDGNTIVGWGNSSTRTNVAGSHDGSHCMQFTNPSAVNPWEAQVAINFESPLTEGNTYYLHFWAKSSVEGTVGAGFQNPVGYSGRGDFPNMDLTTDWKEYTVSTSVTGDNCKRLTLNLGSLAGTILFDDVEVFEMVKGNSIPLTDEEKRDTLTWAMEQWVSNMMKACDGKVKAWDVVNEPMSDGNPFQLKSGAVEGGENNFYWQDYLGKDYVRVVVKFARQYGGDDLKLFVNDYNLEAAYNNNKKCDGLIEMVKYWESDGVTKIDGIGTQMHVSYSLNPATQKRNEEAVVNMLNKLAATGKLIRISELDMGIADETGKEIKTDQVTEEQHHAMAGYYKFIVEKYLEIIPVNQQYGITAWAVTDSPEDSFWRAGMPIGLWDVNYNRKHTYAGFADGLSGK